MVTTSNFPIVREILREERYSFHKKINELVKWHNFLADLVLNFVQTPLFYVTVGKTTLQFEEASNFELQTNYIYCLSMWKVFVNAINLCWKNWTYSHTKGTKISYKFDVTNSGNHWGNGTLENVCKGKFPKMVRIASSKKTKPWENVHDVNIETKLYIMKLIHASSSFIINFETLTKLSKSLSKRLL